MHREVIMRLTRRGNAFARGFGAGLEASPELIKFSYAVVSAEFAELHAFTFRKLRLRQRKDVEFRFHHLHIDTDLAPERDANVMISTIALSTMLVRSSAQPCLIPAIAPVPSSMMARRPKVPSMAAAAL